MYSSMTIHLCSDNYLDRVAMRIFRARSDLAVGAPLGRSRRRIVHRLRGCTPQ